LYVQKLKKDKQGEKTNKLNLPKSPGQQGFEKKDNRIPQKVPRKIKIKPLKLKKIFFGRRRISKVQIFG